MSTSAEPRSLQGGLRVLIASPLEPELAERVAACGAVSDLLYVPDLVPRPRYPNDHGGTPVALTAEQRARWDALVRAADVIFGYPGESSASLAQMLHEGPGIRFVQGTSAGMGAHIRRAALDEATLRRVAFASAAGIHAGMLAEFVVYGLLALRKDARRLERIRRERSWEHFAMGELDGSTLGIVGMGQIGRALAARARAFGMHVVGVTRSGLALREADETYATGMVTEVARRCDALAVTLPLTDLTAGMIDARTIDALPAHAVFANVGRGGVADEAALVRALEEGRILGAVLDVFGTEPLPPEHPFWTMENVVFSPHTAALSRHENARIVDLFCDNLQRFARGSPLRNRVDLIEFY